MIALAPISALVILASSALLFVGVRTVEGLASRHRVLVTVVVALCYACGVYLELRWWWMSDLAVIAIAGVTGAMIGSTLRSSAAVVAFCAAAAIVDLLSFSGGLTRTIVESFRTGESRTLLHLSVAVPVGGSVRPVVGIGDLVILAGLFGGFRQLRFSGWLPFAVPVAGLLVALGVGLAIGGVPAIPFVAVAAVVYVLWRERRGKRASAHGG